MLHIVLAPDSLKGSLSATAACIAMEQGARRALGDAPVRFTHVPLADGGEGTVEALLRGAGGTPYRVLVRGPLGEPVEAHYGVLRDGAAIIEMAQASGLPLVPPAQRDALRATSYGTGEIMRAALDRGCRTLLIGIGGSATTDGGVGALQALGARFLDTGHNDLSPGGAQLQHLKHIDLSQLDARLAQSNITVLCDVTNPLYGPNGAAFIYGPQKGATPLQVQQLDAALQKYARVAGAVTGGQRQDEPGAGAAGGMGFGLLTFTGAQLMPGIEAVLKATRFDEVLEDADLVLTAEGAIDAQTLQGKALAGVAGAARHSRGVPVIAFGGALRLCGAQLSDLGIVAALPLPNEPMALDDCLHHAGELLADAAERTLRLWLCGRNSNGLQRL